jgi:hypothetical protein
MKKIKELRWAGHVARMGRREMRTKMVGKPERKRKLGTRAPRLEGNINGR